MPMKIVALDIGEKRIGVAVADSSLKIPVVRQTLRVSENLSDTYAELRDLLDRELTEKIVVGLPRNSRGEETRQTQLVKIFMQEFQKSQAITQPIIYQDESLTSVLAEQRLENRHVKYTKADIDAEAAAIILSDYLETKLVEDDQ